MKTYTNGNTDKEFKAEVIRHGLNSAIVIMEADEDDNGKWLAYALEDENLDLEWLTPEEAHYFAMRIKLGSDNIRGVVK